MSLKNISLIILSGFIVGILGSFLFQGKPSRKIASELPAPKLRLKPWAHSLTTKTKQAISVEVFAVGGIPDQDHQDLTLRAKVTLNQPMDHEVKFQWTLPQDASLVSGELEDAWPNLLPGQTATTEIVLTGVSKESVAKTVTLHVSALSNGVNFGSSGSFATNSFDPTPVDSSAGIINSQNPKLVLKKSDAAAKMDKVHQ